LNKKALYETLETVDQMAGSSETQKEQAKLILDDFFAKVEAKEIPM
jgi:hypothetical protein